MRNHICKLLLLGLMMIQLTACAPEDDTGEGTLLPPPELSITSLTIDEGSDGAYEVSLLVKLEGLSLTNVVVDYRTVDGTAMAAEDFLAIDNGKLLFTPSETEKEITVTILGDGFVEEDEFFSIQLLNARNATLINGDGRIELLNDDEADDPFGIPDTGYETPLSYPGMTLVWSDDFDSETVNVNDWTFELGTGFNGWGNNELQYYRQENTVVYDGYLVIEARAEEFGGRNYTSSRMITRDKQEFQYGRIDLRAALPEGQGIWPALWMLGANINQIGWPACGEIDIMELVGHDPRRVHGTAHYGASSAQHQFTGDYYLLPVGEKFSDEFHVFSLVWEENHLQWLVDDELFFELTPANVGTAPWPFNKPFFLIFNLAVGGNWPGAPDATTIFPQRLFVDYVRVFQ